MSKSEKLDKIFRCVWCGNLTDSYGKELEGDARIKAIELSKTAHAELRTIKVHGHCCAPQIIN